PPRPPGPPAKPAAPVPPVPPAPIRPAAPPAPPGCPAPPEPPVPPLPTRNPPGPPGRPDPAGALVPLPISGRPNRQLVGAFLAPSRSGPGLATGAAWAPAGAGRAPPAPLSACTNCAWNAAA